MAHIHEKIDYTTATYIVHHGKTLLILHSKLKRWLPVGGHIELDENPEDAAVREAREESGLDVRLIGTKPDLDNPGTKFLIAPAYLDIHTFGDTEHRHIGMVYFAASDTDAVSQQEEEIDDARWVGMGELDDPALALSPSIKFYAQEAIRAWEVDQGQ